MLPHEPNGEPFFVLDEGLNHKVARLMAEIGYPIRGVQEEFKGQSGTVLDPQIIDLISTRYGFRGVWVTKDKSSKREHHERIKARRISVIWIQQQKLSTLQQHRLVTHVLPKATQDLLESSRPIRYLATFQGQPNRERISLKRRRS